MRLKQQAAEFGADEEDDEAEEEEDAAAGRGARWGASKRAYHGADTADVRPTGQLWPDAACLTAVHSGGGAVPVV